LKNVKFHGNIISVIHLVDMYICNCFKKSKLSKNRRS